MAPKLPLERALDAVHDEARCRLLIPKLALKPDNFRVELGRRLQGPGAATVKRNGYVSRRGEGTLEDFQRVVRRTSVALRGAVE